MTGSADGPTPPDYPAMPLGQFLDEVAARQPAPSAGAVAAVTVGLAAGLAAMCAEFSDRRLDDASQLAAEANRLRAEVIPLAGVDAVAFGEVLAVRAVPKDEPGRAERLEAALSAASETPIRVAQLGSEVGVLAARLEQDGNPNVRGDARTARMLAASAVQAAASLVALNLGDPFHPLVQQAVALAEAARATTV